MSPRKEPIFSFVVVGDTHLKKNEPDSSAAWAMNNLSADRNRFIVDEILRLEPRVVIHIGDIVHPVPDLPTFGPAVDLFKQIYSGLVDRIYLVPGNHDIGDKHSSWIPQKKVNPKLLYQYEQKFGETYQSFVIDECLFLILNSSVLNSGLSIEDRQRRWLEAELEAHRRRRKFMFMHYPPFLLDRDESTNYDNVDEPARSDILRLVEEYHVEALFTGHVHNYFYNRVGNTEIYSGLSTSFVRQDFSELARIEAADVNGRNDVDKLGFFHVEVFPEGHVTYVRRSFGAERADGCRLDTREMIRPIHAKTVRFGLVGFHLRHPWAEVIELPYNAPMDEFFRKKVRNDYQVLALSELGAVHLRIPISDLADTRVASRMNDLCLAGHRFTVFCPGIPDKYVQALIVDHQKLIETLEVILPELDDSEVISASVVDRLIALSGVLSVPITLSRVATRPVGADRHARFLQYIDQGFEIHDQILPALVEKIHSVDLKISHLSFRLPRDGLYSDHISKLATFSVQFGIGVVAHVRLAPDNPAENLVDDFKVANIIAEVMFSAHAHQTLRVFIDTFMDIDRGYYVRHGVLDRRYNLRRGGFVFKHLNSLLDPVDSDLSEVSEIVLDVGRAIRRKTRRGHLILLMNSNELQLAPCLMALQLSEQDLEYRVDICDLFGGTVLRQSIMSLLQDPVRYGSSLHYENPILMSIDLNSC